MIRARISNSVDRAILPRLEAPYTARMSTRTAWPGIAGAQEVVRGMAVRDGYDAFLVFLLHMG